MIVTIGIDPGAAGAAALLVDGGFVDCVDWTHGAGVAEKLQEWELLYGAPTLAALEEVGAMPKQGLSSTFKFGVSFGWWQGQLDALRWPWRLVRPQRWMPGLVPAKKNKTDKPGLPVARRMFPAAPLARVKDNGRADAILLGFWAFQQLNGGDR